MGASKSLIILAVLAGPCAGANEFFTDLDLTHSRAVNSVHELEGIGPHLIEIPSTQRTNVVLRAHYFKAKTPKALMLGVHGLQSNGRWFKKTGTFLAQNGI